MTEEIKDLSLTEKIQQFLDKPDHYSVDQANKFLQEWVAYEDDIEENRKAHAEKMKVASVLSKSMNKHNKPHKVENFKEGLSDFIVDIKARTIALKNAIKGKFGKKQ